MDKVKKLNVIFIDDDAVLLKIYEKWFKPYFNKCFLVKNKKEIDNVIISNKIDIIFCDLRINKTFTKFKTGYEVIRYINNKYGKFDFWIISGFLKEFGLDENIKKIISGFIEKPFDKDDILRIFGL